MFPQKLHMDIKLLDSWIREQLDTNAKPHEIARSMSLCGPTFDRTHTVKVNGKTDYLYEIEVTTNRVDLMSVRGIAREASVILPEFGFKAKLKPLKTSKPKAPHKSVPLTIKTNPKLTNRVMGIVLEVDTITKSPKQIAERLQQSGIRSLNAAVDITNYVMTELGHPTHVFDYDLIAPKMVIRESQKNEKIVSLDKKQYTLPGGDIVIDNGKGEIIDLPGIMGTLNSVVKDSTKRILFFLETNDPVKIRKTSMTLGIRTVAATLNEKGVDPELAEVALNRGVQLFQEILGAKVISTVYDSYPRKQKINPVEVSHDFIEDRLGISIDSKRVTEILTKLGFTAAHAKNIYTVIPPSFRAKDITIPEDIVEEVARIYGYHNLPNVLMSGIIPMPSSNAPFEFETKVKQILKELGGHEVYTYSLLPESSSTTSLSLKNPLGSDYSRLRESLTQSLVQAAKDNSREEGPFHLFEIANVYKPKKNDLPNEKMVLSGIIASTDYRRCKGIIEAFLAHLPINYTVTITEDARYLSNSALDILAHTETVGTAGMLAHDPYYFYEFEIEKLVKHHKSVKKYTPIPKFPAHIEDSTFTVKEDIKVSDLIATISSVKDVSRVDLVDIYNQNYTFRIYYQDLQKTLTGEEVDTLRNTVIKLLRGKGANLQS